MGQDDGCPDPKTASCCVMPTFLSSRQDHNLAKTAGSYCYHVSRANNHFLAPSLLCGPFFLQCIITDLPVCFLTTLLNTLRISARTHPRAPRNNCCCVTPGHVWLPVVRNVGDLLHFILSLHPDFFPKRLLTTKTTFG